MVWCCSDNSIGSPSVTDCSADGDDGQYDTDCQCVLWYDGRCDVTIAVLTVLVLLTVVLMVMMVSMILTVSVYCGTMGGVMLQ